MKEQHPILVLINKALDYVEKVHPVLFIVTFTIMTMVVVLVGHAVLSPTHFMWLIVLSAGFYSFLIVGIAAYIFYIIAANQHEALYKNTKTEHQDSSFKPASLP